MLSRVELHIDSQDRDTLSGGETTEWGGDAAAEIVPGTGRVAKDAYVTLKQEPASILDVLDRPSWTRIPSFADRCAGSIFASAFQDEVRKARRTELPECLEHWKLSRNRASLYQAWLAPSSRGDAREESQAAQAIDAREEESRRTIANLRRLVANLSEERDRLLCLATRDSLTGLWNRRAILELLAKGLASAERDQRPFAVIMADIDGFKSLNDRFGHAIGDAILGEIARRLCSCVRRSDEVGRYGGEEFLIMLPGCDGPTALARAEQFRLAVGGTFLPCAEERLQVTCSLGLQSAGNGNYDRDTLIREADAALYQAKRLGRDRVEMYAN